MLKIGSVVFVFALIASVPLVALAQGTGTTAQGVLGGSTNPGGTTSGSATASTGGTSSTGGTQATGNVSSGTTSAGTGGASGTGTTTATGSGTGGTTTASVSGTTGGSARAVEPVSLLLGGAGLAGAALLRRALRK